MNKTWVVLALLLASTLPLRAAEDAEELNRRYLKLKDSADYYLGEGVAKVSEFDGDGLKALEAARERARASLASSVRVRITSETKEHSKAGSEGSSESVESKSASLADVVLENVRVEDFVGLPQAGQVTALALLDKADYRRQLAGKSTPVYRPQYGIKLAVWGLSLPSFDKIENSGTANGQPTDAPLANSGGGSSDSGSGIAPGYGLEFVWKDFSVGFDFYRKNTSLYVYDPALDHYEVKTDGLGLWMGSLGWQYIPWNWRVQPFFPLGIHGGGAGWTMYSAFSMAASAGAGLRYWPSDAFSLEVSYRYFQGFNSAVLTKDGVPLRLRKGQPDADFTLTGSQTRVAIQWSGF